MAEDLNHFPLDRRWVLVRAGLAIAAGIAALLFPPDAHYAFTLLIAAYAAGDGLAALASSPNRDGKRFWAYAAHAGIGIASALAFLVAPRLSFVSSTFPTLAIASSWAAASGLLEIVAELKADSKKRGATAVAIGFLSIILALAMPVLAFFRSANTIANMAWLIGLFLIVIGALHGLRAKQLRSEARQ